MRDKILVLTLLLAVPAGATVLEAWDTARLVSESDMVVHARIGTQRGVSSDGRMVFTDTSLRVLRYIVGSGPAELTVRQLGGVWRDRSVVVGGNASLREGREAILFLGRESGRLWIVGMAQGAYEIQGDKVVRRVDAPLARGRTFLPSGAGDRTISQRQLLSEIRAAKRRQP